MTEITIDEITEMDRQSLEAYVIEMLKEKTVGDPDNMNIASKNYKKAFEVYYNKYLSL